MNKLNLKLTGSTNLGQTQVLANGTPLTFKNNEFKNLTSIYETEQSKVRIEIVKFLDVGGFVWFITQLFFFVISIFGLFDIHGKPKCYVTDFVVDVNLKEENNVTLKINSPSRGAKVADVQTDLEIEELSNSYVEDNNAVKKFKNLKIAKIFLGLAIVVTAILLIIFV